VQYTPYLDNETRKRVTRPVIEVVIEHLGKPIPPTLGLVDSGSECTVFNAEFGDAIGIPVERGTKKSISGVKGAIDCYPHEVTIKFLSGKHAKEIKTKIMFSRDYKHPFVLLGRDIIFKLYEITFNDNEKKFVFKKFAP